MVDEEQRRKAVQGQARELLKQGEEIRGMLDFYYLNPPKFRPGQFRAWAKHRWWREFNDPIWEGWYRYSIIGTIVFVLLPFLLLAAFVWLGANF